jgi:hypothetical protein
MGKKEYVEVEMYGCLLDGEIEWDKNITKNIVDISKIKLTHLISDQYGSRALLHVDNMTYCSKTFQNKEKLIKYLDNMFGIIVLFPNENKNLDECRQDMFTEEDMKFQLDVTKCQKKAKEDA